MHMQSTILTMLADGLHGWLVLARRLLPDSSFPNQRTIAVNHFYILTTRAVGRYDPPGRWSGCWAWGGQGGGGEHTEGALTHQGHMMSKQSVTNRLTSGVAKTSAYASSVSCHDTYRWPTS